MTARQTTYRRQDPKTLTPAQETAFAVVLGLLGFLITAFLVLNFDDFRFAFAEWGDEAADVAAADEPADD